MTVVGAFLLLTFFCFRVLLSPYLLIHMATGWTNNGPMYLFYLNMMIGVFFLVMNYYWFFLLVRLMFGSKKKVQ